MQATSVEHDPTYYFEDGDCYILVEDTMFCVHKILLKRDNSVFEDMFTLPQGDVSAPSDGSSEALPLTLPGDTADEFRALCWCLYALPCDISKVCNERWGPKDEVYSPPDPSTGSFLSPLITTSFPRLLQLVQMSHKYGFSSIYTWSFDVLHKNWIEIGFFGHPMCSPRMYRAVLALLTIVLSEGFQGSDVMKRLTRDHLERLRILPTNLVASLQLAEEFHMRELQAKVYYRIFVEAATSALENKMPIMGYLQSSLADHQKNALFRGVTALVGYADTMRSYEWIGEDTCRCRSSLKNKCWNSRKDAIVYAEGRVPNTISSLDILGRLETMCDREVLKTAPSWNDIPTSCEDRVQRTIELKAAEIRGQLIECFLGPE